MHSSVGIPEPIFMTARHFVNFAPSSTYSASLSFRPSKPWVITSSEPSCNGTKPLSTLIPGRAPAAFIISTSFVPSSDCCLMVSSNSITPPILPSIPEALKSISL